MYTLQLQVVLLDGFVESGFVNFADGDPFIADDNPVPDNGIDFI